MKIWNIEFRISFEDALSVGVQVKLGPQYVSNSNPSWTLGAFYTKMDA